MLPAPRPLGAAASSSCITLVLFDELTYRLGELLIGKELHPWNRVFEVTSHGCVSPRDSRYNGRGKSK